MPADKNRPVIIGNSTAAIAAMEAIHLHAPDLSPVLVSDEALPPYSPTALLPLLEGKIREEDFFFRHPDVYRRNRTKPRLGKKASRIDVENRWVILEDGEKIPFSILLIAAGARPASFPPGLSRQNLFTLRNLAGARQLQTRLQKAKSVLIIGAGLIGMEAAQVFLSKGIAVTVAELQDRILPSSLDSDGASMIQRAYEERGVRFLLGIGKIEIDSSRGGEIGEILLDGRMALRADFFIWAAGISPRIELVEGTEIGVDRGILVNQRMETSLPGIYAAGDIAQAPGFFSSERILNPILPAAAEQGRIAGINMAGAEAECPGNLKMNIFSFWGRRAVSIGEISPQAEDEVIHLGQIPQQCGKIVMRQGRLVGGIFINFPLEPGIFKAMVLSQEDFSSRRAALMEDIDGYSRSWMVRRRIAGVGPRGPFSASGRRIPDKIILPAGGLESPGKT